MLREKNSEIENRQFTTSVWPEGVSSIYWQIETMLHHLNPQRCSQLTSLKAFTPNGARGASKPLQPIKRDLGRSPGKRQEWSEQLVTVQRNVSPSEKLASEEHDFTPDTRGDALGGIPDHTDSSEFSDMFDIESSDANHGEGSWASSEDFDEGIFNINFEGIVQSKGIPLTADEGWKVEGLDAEEEWGVVSDDAQQELERIQQSKSSRDDGREERWKESAALQSLPRHVLRVLHEYQDEADALSKDLTKASRRKRAAEAKTHRRLRVISGDIAGRRLLSGKGETTRPMMEKVRAAVFDMLHSRCGSLLRLPQGSKWLDLFAGTGSVGLEALSRGAEQCHFIELDRWVVDSVLMPNLASCRMVEQSVVHSMKAEDYLSRAKDAPEYATAFDFISVCPPYLKVSYEELFGLLESSPLVHAETHIIVEYPRKSKSSIPKMLGRLKLVRDRKFGRTNMALFGPE